MEEIKIVEYCNKCLKKVDCWLERLRFSTVTRCRECNHVIDQDFDDE